MRKFGTEIWVSAAVLGTIAVLGSLALVAFKTSRQREQTAETVRADSQRVAAKRMQQWQRWLTCLYSAGPLTLDETCPGRTRVLDLVATSITTKAGQLRLLVDGDDATMWCGAGTSPGAIRLTFSQETRISGLRVVARERDPRNRKVGRIRAAVLSWSDGSQPIELSWTGENGLKPIVIGLPNVLTSWLDFRIGDDVEPQRNPTFCVSALTPIGANAPELGRPVRAGSPILGIGAEPPDDSSKPRPPPDAPSLIREGEKLVQARVTMPQALDKFNQAAALDPGNAQVHYRIAYCYYRLNRLQEALSWADKAEPLAASRPVVASNIEVVRARVAEIQRAWDEARGHYQRALELNATNDWAFLSQSTMENYLNPPQELIAVVSKALAGEALTEEDVAPLARGDLRLLRNGLFARHGLDMNDIGLNRFFYDPAAGERFSQTLRLDSSVVIRTLTGVDATNLSLVRAREVALANAPASTPPETAASTTQD